VLEWGILKRESGPVTSRATNSGHIVGCLHPHARDLTNCNNYGYVPLVTTDPHHVPGDPSQAFVRLARARRRTLNLKPHPHERARQAAEGRPAREPETRSRPTVFTVINGDRDTPLALWSPPRPDPPIRHYIPPPRNT